MELIDFQNYQEIRRRNMMSINQKKTQVISVTSGKGGVGKTTSTVNLALALVQSGNRVLILDADLGLANINIMLGFKPQKTIDDILNGNASVEDIIIHHHSGIDIIPASSGVYEVTNISDDSKRSLLAAFESIYGIYDYLLIDTSAGIGSNVLYFNSAAEKVLVILDPEPTSITDAYAVIKVLSNEGVRNFEVLVNRAAIGNDGKDTFKKLLNATDRFLNVNVNFIGCIQEDDSVVESIMKQTPLLSIYPSTRASRDYVRVAKKIESLPRSNKTGGGLQFFFESLIRNN